MYAITVSLWINANVKLEILKVMREISHTICPSKLWVVVPKFIVIPFSTFLHNAMTHPIFNLQAQFYPFINIESAIYSHGGNYLKVSKPTTFFLYPSLDHNVFFGTKLMRSCTLFFMILCLVFEKNQSEMCLFGMQW